jgi:hypothetical protein
MITSMLWKEYRQQRAGWLTVTLLAIAFVEGLLATLSSQFAQHEQIVIRTLLTIVIMGAVAGYGLVSGATLIAGEKEDGTLPYLDNLTGRRGAIWRGKLCAGALLTLAQGIVLGAYCVARGVGAPHEAVVLPAFSLIGLTWGVLGGALCGHILTAALTAAPLMGIVWALSIPFGNVPYLIVITQVGAFVAAAVTAQRRFCYDDRLRRAHASDARMSPGTRPFRSWIVTGWLALRQGKWVLAGLAAGSILLAATAHLAPLFIWPIGSAVLGLGCGLTVFAPDQRSGHLYWGNQRFPRGRIWIAKVTVWAALFASALFLVWFVQTSIAWPTAFEGGTHFTESRDRSWPFLGPSAWIRSWHGPQVEPERSLDPTLFLALWPIYGFCVALFLGQSVRRTVVALVLALAATPAVLALWVPSFLIGGLPVWQVLAIPLMLLATTRLSFRPWVSNRLWSRRPRLGICMALGLMAVWLAGCLWYRVLEVPDVGEPFDVQGFIKSLPSSEQNKASRLVRIGFERFEERIVATEAKLPFLRSTESPSERGPGVNPASSFIWTDFAESNPEPLPRLETAKLGPWLDMLFAGEWCTVLREASSLPLGVYEPNPGHTLASQRVSYDAGNLGWVMHGRTRQLAAHGAYDEALREMAMTLGIARQLKNKAPLEVYRAGTALEIGVVYGDLHGWLRAVGSNRELLAAAATMLKEHKNLSPAPANAMMAEYLVLREINPFSLFTNSPLDVTYRTLAAKAPWEMERQRRVFNATTLGALSTLRPTWQTNAYRLMQGQRDPYVLAAAMVGLPAARGPTSELSVTDWGRLILESWPHPSSYASIRDAAQRSTQALRAAEAALALRRYFADFGALPARIEDLVPAYLNAVPIDPSTGMPAWFEVYETEEVALPALIASMTGSANSSAYAGLNTASALAAMIQRFPVLVDVEGSMGPGMGSGAAGPGIGAPPPFGAAAGPGEAASLPPLVPHAVVHIGSLSYEVSIPTKR